MTDIRHATNVEVVSYAVGVLGGAKRLVHTERIAVLCQKIAPAQFSWVLKDYRSKGWPDKEVVRNSLEDAKKEKNDALVIGKYERDTSKDGWRLTAKGAAWFLSNRDRMTSQLEGVPRYKAGKGEKHLLKQVQDHSLFASFDRTGEVRSPADLYSFLDLLNCSPDAKDDVIRTKLDRLLAVSDIAGDCHVKQFLLRCGKEFLSE